MLHSDFLHPLNIYDIVGMSILVNRTGWNRKGAAVDMICIRHDSVALKRRFTLFDECLDAFLSIWMSGAVTDALSFQFQLCFQRGV